MSCPHFAHGYPSSCTGCLSDRVAELTAELAEARLYKDDVERFEEEVKAERAAHERTKARVAELEHDAYGLISRANYLSKISSESWEEMKAERDAVQSEAAALSKRVAELEAILGRQ